MLSPIIQTLKNAEKTQPLNNVFFKTCTTFLLFLGIAIKMFTFEAFGSSINIQPPTIDENNPMINDLSPPREPTPKELIDKLPKLLVNYINNEAFLSILDPVKEEPITPKLQQNNPYIIKVFEIEEIIRDDTSIIFMRKGIKGKFPVKEEINIDREKRLQAIAEIEILKSKLASIMQNSDMRSPELVAIKEAFATYDRVLQTPPMRIDISLKNFVESLGGHYDYDVQDNIHWIQWP